MTQLQSGDVINNEKIIEIVDINENVVDFNNPDILQMFLSKTDELLNPILKGIIDGMMKEINVDSDLYLLKNSLLAKFLNFLNEVRLYNFEWTINNLTGLVNGQGSKYAIVNGEGSKYGIGLYPLVIHLKNLVEIIKILSKKPNFSKFEIGIINYNTLLINTNYKIRIDVEEIDAETYKILEII